MGAGVSTFVTSTNSASVSFEFLSFEGFQRVSQLPDDLRSTVTEVVAVVSISPKDEVSGTYLSQSTDNDSKCCVHPMFFIAILNFFQLQRYLPPLI